MINEVQFKIVKSSIELAGYKIKIKGDGLEKTTAFSEDMMYDSTLLALAIVDQIQKQKIDINKHMHVKGYFFDCWDEDIDKDGNEVEGHGIEFPYNDFTGLMPSIIEEFEIIYRNGEDIYYLEIVDEVLIEKAKAKLKELMEVVK